MSTFTSTSTLPIYCSPLSDPSGSDPYKIPGILVDCVVLGEALHRQSCIKRSHVDAKDEFRIPGVDEKTSGEDPGRQGLMTD